MCSKNLQVCWAAPADPLFQHHSLRKSKMIMAVAWENNTLHFDQYSQLTIRLNIFQFSADIQLKRDLKFDKKKSISYSKARRDKSI